jgi:hypothetical protein
MSINMNFIFRTLHETHEFVVIQGIKAMKTSVNVRQTKIFMSAGCNTMLTHYPEVDQTHYPEVEPKNSY